MNTEHGVRTSWRTTQESEISHSAAHYLMAIHRLREEFGYARTTDVAARLEVSRGAVSMAMTQLKKRALATEDPHRFLLLTDKGYEVVHEVEHNFEVLSQFLKDVLHTPPETAHADACRMEHLLSLETGRRLLWLMQAILEDPAGADWVRRIMASFPESGSQPPREITESNDILNSSSAPPTPTSRSKTKSPVQKKGR